MFCPKCLEKDIEAEIIEINWLVRCVRCGYSEDRNEDDDFESV